MLFKAVIVINYMIKKQFLGESIDSFRMGSIKAEFMFQNETWSVLRAILTVFARYISEKVGEDVQIETFGIIS